ncbi:MAG: DUF1439 domain-containing protein [Methylococcales bacterium]|nr:DUF1439 domain-containing protein [Methylococcales bacterium]
MAFTYILELSEAKLQKKVSSMMPMEKNKYFLSVILSEPEVELIEGGSEIGLYIHIEVRAAKGISANASGRVKLTGALSYQADTSEFFFKNPTIESLEIARLSEKYLVSVKKIIQLIARKMLAVRPIYKLKDDKVKHKVAKSMLQSISVNNKKLLLELKVL